MVLVELNYEKNKDITYVNIYKQTELIDVPKLLDQRVINGVLSIYTKRKLFNSIQKEFENNAQ